MRTGAASGARSRAGALALGALAFACGCNGIFGIEEKRFVAAAGGGGSDEGGSSAGGGGAGQGGGGGQGGGACTADLLSDEEHCGACGHSCLGGKCEGGRCKPAQLASGATPSRIAVDDTHVYWTDYHGGRIRRISKAGGTPEQLFASDLGAQHYTWDLALGEDAIYFTVYNFNPAPGWIGRMAKDGSGQTALAEGVQGAWGMALDSGNVYWANRWDERAVTSVPREGGELAVLVSGPPVADMVAYIAVDDTFVYWPDRQAGTVSRRPKGGGDAEVLVTGALEPYLVVVDGEDMFWAEAVQNLGAALWRTGKDGSGSEMLAIAEGIGGVVADGEHVYFTVTTGPTYPFGAVMRARKDGEGEVETLASGYTGAQGIAVDAQAIYWVCQFDSAVMRLAK